MIVDNEKAMASADFWDDSQSAKKFVQQQNQLIKLVNNFQDLNQQMITLLSSLDDLKNEYDQEMFELVQQESLEALKQFNQFETQLLLNQEYDRHSAIVEIHPGAGGTESQDWALMLYRMYTRFGNSKNFKVTTLEYLDGEEAGIKSVTFQIEGDFAYGYLKGEKGVHRLVRISPFDSSGRRHTSFASVDVMPLLDESDPIELNMNELEIDTHRASGAGGQHVNKTDSAVRITHIPTGISVHVQSERSQTQNRAQALILIKSKLEQLRQIEQAEKISDLKGEQKNIEWGSQIRSYVFMPYTLVKDHRSLAESGNVAAVMDGDLDLFIDAYLRMSLKQEK